MHSVPHRRLGVVLGLVNIRGELFICVSLARLLGLAQDICRERLRREPLRLLVVHAETQRFAFPVDEVHGVHRFNLDELESPPATVAHAQRSFTRGVLRWRRHMVGCLNAEALFCHLNHSLS
jgi:chemotaxis-related protein WspD